MPDPIPTPSPIAAPVAESAATPLATPTPTDRLAAMTPTERADWRVHGSTVRDTPVVSAPADGDAGDGDELEAAAAPGPAATPDPAASAAGKALAARKRTAQDRINELTRKNHLLEGELTGLRSAQSSRPAAAAETPAPAPAPAPAAGDGLVEPHPEDFETYPEFTRAQARYEIRLAQAADRQARAQQGQAQEFFAAVATHNTRVETFAASHPDYYDVITAQTAVMPTPLLAEAVLHSELAPELAYHLNTHLDEYRALLALPSGPMLKALGKLEARLEAAAPAPAVAPLAKHVTTAPAPPVTLGSRPALPADAAASATARRDFSAYRDAQNAKDLAARR